MLDLCRQRTLEFCGGRSQQIPVAVITDQSSIAYLAGFWGYLSVEFGRPTFLVLRPDKDPVVVTPLMETEMVGRMTWVERVLSWTDAGDELGGGARQLGPAARSSVSRRARCHPSCSWLSAYPARRFADAARVLGGCA